MDRLHSMRAFVRVIDAGSFAGAAREMNLSPAVVTRLVADLEEHLGARLINRTTRRLALSLAISRDRAGMERTLGPLLQKNDKAAWRTRARPSSAAGWARWSPR